jgi:hypothetical protein
MTPTYQLSCGVYGWAALPTWLCTPDLALALRCLAGLQQQGYDWCALHVKAVPLREADAARVVQRGD